MSRFTAWIKKLLNPERPDLMYKKCLRDMEYQGKAAFGYCNGMLGGDGTTGYLQYKCVSCSYLFKEDDS